MIWICSLNDLTPEKCRKVLIQAIANILMKCKDKTYRIVTLNRNRLIDSSTEEATESNQDSGSSSTEMMPSQTNSESTTEVKTSNPQAEEAQIEEDDRMKISMENLESIEKMETVSNLVYLFI